MTQKAQGDDIDKLIDMCQEMYNIIRMKLISQYCLTYTVAHVR